MCEFFFFFFFFWYFARYVFETSIGVIKQTTFIFLLLCVAFIIFATNN